MIDYENGWLPIDTAPMTQDDILVCGWHYEYDEDTNEILSKERYITIGSMVDTEYRRCIGHRNGPRNVTHWRPLPKPPEYHDDTSSEANLRY